MQYIQEKTIWLYIEKILFVSRWGKCQYIVIYGNHLRSNKWEKILYWDSETHSQKCQKDIASANDKSVCQILPENATKQKYSKKQKFGTQNKTFVNSKNYSSFLG